MSETRIDGRAVGFRREEGEPPTLVFMHGAGGNRIAFDPLLDELVGLECLAVDRPGRFDSEGPAIEGFEGHVDFMRSFLASEVTGDYVLVGHSLGGAIAIELALAQASPSLRGVILLATGARLKVHPMILSLFEELASTGAPAGLSPGLLEHDASDAMVALAERYVTGTPSTTGLCDWRSTAGFDRMADLSRISVPALVVAGSEDPLTPPKYAEYMHAHIPTSELHVLDGAAHMFPMERPTRVAELIRSFVAGL